MFSLKIRYALYGTIVSASLITLVAQASTVDGVFGTYFRNMITTACTGTGVLTGFDDTFGSAAYGTKICTALSVPLAGYDIYPVGGNVGIGAATTPNASLEVKRSITDANYVAWLDGLNVNNYGLGVNIANMTSSTNIADFMAGYVSRLVIRGDGNVGIGTSTPTARLEVAGNVIAATPTLSGHLATKGYVDAQVVSAGGVSGGGSCYYTNSPVCINGYGKAPGTYSTNYICCPMSSQNNTCQYESVGASCSGNTIYAGFYNNHRYMTTPGGCDDSTTPFCSGGTDYLKKSWSSNAINNRQYSTTTGDSNTTYLATNDPTASAARYCYDMVYGGYDDWFLPALDELRYVIASTPGIGFNSYEYWSSTEHSDYDAYYKDGSGRYNNAITKINIYLVHCVRKF